LADRERYPLIIKYNYVTDYVRCQICAIHTSLEVGPAIFRENGGAVCDDCSSLYAPELREVLPHAQRLYVEACSHLWSRTPQRMD
jgi:hypothetical protein